MGRIAISGSSAGYLSHTTAAYLESISRPRVRVKFKGDAFTNLPTFNNRQLFVFTGKNNLRVLLNRNGTDINLVFGEDNNGTASTSTVLLSSLSTTLDYEVYFKAGSGTNDGSGPGTISLIDSSGSTVIGPTSVPWYTTGTSGASTGAFRLGGDTTNAWAIDFDGCAIFNADPASTTDVPATSNSGIVALWGFDDGSGSTAVNQVSGGTSLTATNGTFSGTSGTWDYGGATTFFRPYFITG
jgi:hypothetical protein